MAASTQQKVDFLLKKIGYTASKTGIAEDGSLTGTKKSPSGEAIPSPLVVPTASVWADSSFIPTTPPAASTGWVEPYLVASSGHRMTEDSTVSGSRTFIAHSTYNNSSSAVLGDWIDTQFGDAYIVKVYKGDPNSGGVQLSAAGAGSNDTWFFDYSSGVLNFNGDQIPSGVTSSNVYIVGYRYTGTKGLQQPGGLTTATSLIISGLSTFSGLVDINAGGQADTFKIEDLTDNRVVIVGPGGEIEDDANFTFNGQTLELGSGTNLRVGGASTFVGNVTFQGGVIGLGDSTSDAVVFNADIDSSFIPDDDDTYNIGSATQQWKDIHIDGVAYVDDLSVDSVVGSYATITTVKATNADLNDAKITTGITTNFTVGQVVGDGSLTINAPTGINSHTDLPDNVMVRFGSDDDLTVEHVDVDGFTNRGHTQFRHANGDATYSRLQVRSDYFSVQTAAGSSDFLTADNKTLKLMYADTAASGIGDRLIIRASGSEMLGIVTFKDNGVYKGEVAIGSSITATAGVVTANAIDVIDADIEDAKITAGLATAFAITTANIHTGIVTTMAIDDLQVSTASTNTGITSTQNLFVVGVATVGGSLNVNGINITGAGGTVVAGFGTDLISQNLLVTGIATVSQVTVGKGSSETKINTNSGELVLDSAAGQVTIQDNVHVVGYATFRNGLYYRSDQGGSTGIGYSGPNGIAYFEDDGRLVSTASTVGFLTTTNYMMTTNASGVPQWSDSIDGGFF